MAVKVLGIDPGTAACGYGIVERTAAGMRPHVHGWWRTTPHHPLERRLKTLYDGVAELIAAHEPDAVVLEECFVGADARTALSVGQARGAVLVAAAAAGVACAEYAPAHVKRAVCGYGRAEKVQVQRMVQTILRLDDAPAPTHAADALAVAICHALAPPLASVGG
jgi:crossover junction endodeoxyribonuclease RuvC